LSQEELEAHPEWKQFGTEAGKHPPMRGWLAAPILDRHGVNWGLFQLSDKVEGEFTAEDERLLLGLLELVASALEGWWAVRNLRQSQAS
jgi:GAF domain-containing protein